jgi:hypothetical protein
MCWRIGIRFSSRISVALAIAAAIIAIAVLSLATYPNAMANEVGSTTTTATTIPAFTPPDGAPVIATGSLRGGRTWNVVAGDAGCFFPGIAVGAGTARTNLCAGESLRPEHLKWTRLWTHGSPDSVVLVVALQDTSEIRATSRNASGKRATVLAKPISAPVHGYVAFLVPVPWNNRGFHAVPVRS